MTPSTQVKAGSLGLIVNAAHLTTRGADRIEKIASAYLGRSDVVHRLGFNTISSLEVSPGPGVDPAFRAAFGRTRAADRLPSFALGFVDLRRIEAAAAAELAAGQAAAPRDVDAGGVLVTVTEAGVRMLPPAPLEGFVEHVETELRRPRPRPTVARLHRMVEPMFAAGRRVNVVTVPPHVAIAAAQEWGGDDLRRSLEDAQAAGLAWDAPKQASRRQDGSVPPPLAIVQIGMLQVMAAPTESDRVSIMSAKGPALRDETRWDHISLLAANPQWNGALDGEAQQTYARLRTEGLDPEAALRVLPELLST